MSASVGKRPCSVLGHLGPIRGSCVTGMTVPEECNQQQLFVIPATAPINLKLNPKNSG